MKLSPLEAVKAVSSRQHTSVGGGTNPAAIAESSDFNNKMAPPPMQTSPSSMDWRRTERESNAATSSSSQSYLTQLAKWDHARGVKQEGCPCCDADNLSNALDMIMMLYPLVFLFGGSWPSTRSRSFQKLHKNPRLDVRHRSPTVAPSFGGGKDMVGLLPQSSAAQGE